MSKIIKSEIKIACVDNMNNNMFCLARYLRDLGYSADVFVTNTGTMPHFTPQNDSYENDFKNFVYNVDWENLKPTQRKIETKKVFSNYDLIIGCGLIPAYLNEINRRLDIFLPYGADIFVIPQLYIDAALLEKIFYLNFKIVKKIFYMMPQQLSKHFRSNYFKLDKNYENFYISKQQILGIQKAKVTILIETNEISEQQYKNINSKSKRLKIGFPFIYVPIYTAQNTEKVKGTSPYYGRFKSIRDSNKLVIFHHARHVWKNSFEPTSWKANDVLIKGFAEFLKQSNNYNACLVMFEYGGDVDESKQLIKRLGIEKNIEWFPTMPRKDIMIGLSLADIGCSEFAISWVMGGTIFEILCMGKPLFHYLEEKLYAKEDIFPHVNIKSKEDITKHLLGYIDNSKPYIEQGIRGQNWFFENAINKPLESIKIELNNLLTNNNN